MNLVLPAWADRVRQLYLAGEANVFIVHGNVQDYVFNGTKLTPMLEFIDAWMGTTKKSVYCSAGSATAVVVIPVHRRTL